MRRLSVTAQFSHHLKIFHWNLNPLQKHKKQNLSKDWEKARRTKTWSRSREGLPTPLYNWKWLEDSIRINYQRLVTTTSKFYMWTTIKCYGPGRKKIHKYPITHLASLSILSKLNDRADGPDSLLRQWIKDVRANCFCASLLRTQFTSWCHATSYIERARFWRNVEIYSASGTFN